jgi:hypothetical protein
MFVSPLDSPRYFLQEISGEPQSDGCAIHSVHWGQGIFTKFQLGQLQGVLREPSFCPCRNNPMLERGAAGFFVKVALPIATSMASVFDGWLGHGFECLGFKKTWRCAGVDMRLRLSLSSVVYMAMVSFGLDLQLLCTAAVGFGESFPWSVCYRVDKGFVRRRAFRGVGVHSQSQPLNRPLYSIVLPYSERRQESCVGVYVCVLADFGSVLWSGIVSRNTACICA